MFRASSAHLQEDIVVYKQHMVPSPSIRVLVACRYAAGVRTDWRGKVVGRASQWRTQEFFSGGGGFQQIQLRTERTGIWGW